MGAAERLSHVPEAEGSGHVATVRTCEKVRTGQIIRLLSQPERERRKAAFSTVCERYGAIARIARAWGVSDSVVRKVRDGLAPLTDDRIRALPRAQRAHLFEVLDASAQLSLF